MLLFHTDWSLFNSDTLLYFTSFFRHSSGQPRWHAYYAPLILFFCPDWPLQYFSSIRTSPFNTSLLSGLAPLILLFCPDWLLLDQRLYLTSFFQQSIGWARGHGYHTPSIILFDPEWFLFNRDIFIYPPSLFRHPSLLGRLASPQDSSHLLLLSGLAPLSPRHIYTAHVGLLITLIPFFSSTYIPAQFWARTLSHTIDVHSTSHPFSSRSPSTSPLSRQHHLGPSSISISCTRCSVYISCGAQHTVISSVFLLNIVQLAAFWRWSLSFLFLSIKSLFLFEYVHIAIEPPVIYQLIYS